MTHNTFTYDEHHMKTIHGLKIKLKSFAKGLKPQSYTEHHMHVIILTCL